jgi:hypothetical protein
MKHPMVVIESHEETGVVWGVSLVGCNPPPEEFVRCRDGAHATQVMFNFDAGYIAPLLDAVRANVAREEGMTRTEFAAWLRKDIHDRGETQKEAATRIGVSATYLSEVLQGGKAPGDGILAPLGMECQIRFVPTSPKN